MSLWLGVRHRLRSLLRRRSADAETREELADHLARQTAKHIAAGMSPADAHRRAALELGGAEQYRGATADVRTGRVLEDLVADARYALRGLMARPGFALSAIATLAIGIGAATTIAALADGALLRPLPFPGADRAMALTLRMPLEGSRGVMDMTWSYPKYQLFRDRQRVFSALALHSAETLTILGDEGGERVSGEMAGAAYFDVLGIAPARGRTYTPDEDRPGGATGVAVIGDGFWRARFGGRPDVLGQRLTIGGAPYAIIGVMPPGFTGLSGDAQIWIPTPAARSADALAAAGAHNMELVARLAKGVTPGQARAATIVLGRSVSEVYDTEGPRWGADARTLAALRVNSTLRRSVELLAVAAALLTLIVCVNLSTLLLTRASARRRELAIRVALGGGRGRMLRLLGAEGATIAVLGGLGGLVLALFATRALAAMLPASMPTTGVGTDLSRLTFASIRLDLRGIGFGAALTLMIGVGTSVLAGARAAAGVAIESLRQGAASAGPGRGTTRTGLVVAQVALGLVFLVASGITLESFRRVLAVPLGYRPEGLLAVRVTLDPARTGAEPAAAMWREITARIQAVPGVSVVATGSCSPIGMHCDGTDITPVGHAAGHVMYLTASPGYFEALGIRVLRGRGFEAADTAGGGVMLINSAAARALWGGDDPLATPVMSVDGSGTPIRVVGVVDDVRYGDVEQPAPPTIYMPFSSRRGVVFVRTTADPGPLVALVRRAITAAGAGHAAGQVKQMSLALRDATVRNRLVAEVFTAFALGALLLAAVGVYGTLALGVVQRTRELAIRRALGATGASVLRSIGVETTRIGVLGILAGGAGALALNLLLASSLYGIERVESRVYVVGSALLLTALALAAVVPALRSLRVEPKEALRSE